MKKGILAGSSAVSGTGFFRPGVFFKRWQFPNLRVVVVHQDGNQRAVGHSNLSLAYSQFERDRGIGAKRVVLECFGFAILRFEFGEVPSFWQVMRRELVWMATAFESASSVFRPSRAGRK